MAIEGLDAQAPIETAGFVPRADVPQNPETDAEPTLDAALREAPDRAAMREATARDLWVTHAGGTAFAALAHHGAGVAESLDPPVVR
jgi:hypothetical protein